MNKLLALLITISLLGLFSCEKDETSETPGNIPGLGNAPGEPEIKAKYVLPENISIVGDITGLENANQKETNLKSAGVRDLVYGSGSDVKLRLTLRNGGKKTRTIFLPKGLIWKNRSGNFQHGLQIQTIWINLKPGSTKQVTIHLYCANLKLPTPDHSSIYHILGITSSKIIWNFLDLIGWKMVNYEMIETEDELKSTGSPSFNDITVRMQQIIEKLTDNGEPISEDDKKFIKSIPNVENKAALSVLKDAIFQDDLEEYSELVAK